MKTSLARYENNGIELFVDIDGSCYASNSALARMCGVSENGIRKFLRGNQISPKILEIPTNQGIQRGNLYNEDNILLVLAHYNPNMLLNFAKLGLRVFLHQLIGYESNQPQNIYARRVQIASNWNIPKGYFCVFHEISLLANKIGQEYQVGEYDLIDGSVGKCWSKYRKGKEWALPTIKFPIEFGDKRDSAHVEVTGYSNHELIHFREWLEDIYRYENLPKYLSGKYSGIL